MKPIIKIQQPIMNQSDIKYMVRILNKSIKQQDWELVTEAIEYIQEFQEDPQYEDE